MIKLLHLSEDDFQSQKAAKCDLLIHIGIETFQYAVIDIVSNELKVLAEYEIPENISQTDLISAIKNFPESSREFKYPYNKIRIAIDSFQFTFIPDELFLPDNEKEYAKFIRPSMPAEILTNSIVTAKIRNIFAINSEFNVALNQIFHKPKLFSQASSFIAGIQLTYPENNKPALFIDIHSKHIQIACFNNSALSFYNIFECHSPDDLNYFVLNVLDALALNTELCSVILSGNVTSEDENYQRIKKYFNKISFADSTQLVKFSNKFDTVLPQTYFSLICLKQCES